MGFTPQPLQNVTRATQFLALFWPVDLVEPLNLGQRDICLPTDRAALGGIQMKWDFWHLVLALIIAIVAAALIISIIVKVVSFILTLLWSLLVIAIIVGLIYVAYRIFVPHRA